MVLQDVDFDVATVIEKFGLFVICADDWTTIIANRMEGDIANPDVVIQESVVRLHEAGVLGAEKWRVCRSGDVWLRDNEEIPPFFRQEQPRDACVYLLDAGKLQQLRESHKPKPAHCGSFVK